MFEGARWSTISADIVTKKESPMLPSFRPVKLHLAYSVANRFAEPDGKSELHAHKDRIIDVSKLSFWGGLGCIYLIVRNRSKSEITISDWQLSSAAGGVMFTEGDELPFRIAPKDYAVIALPEFSNGARKSSQLWRAEVSLGSGQLVKSRQRILVPPQTKWGGRGDSGLAYNPSEERRQKDISALAKEISDLLRGGTNFYRIATTSYMEARARLETFKFFIEKQDGYKLLQRTQLHRLKEEHVQILFQAVWHGTPYDVNREVANGRGAVDFAISMGAGDKCLVEFKLASNSRLQHGLLHQIEVYKEANRTTDCLYVVLFLNSQEEEKAKQLLRKLKAENRDDIILIDARPDNKESASRGRTSS
jgi:hypothetical protein